MTCVRLFHRMYPILVRFTYQRVADADQAEDIAQEAFIRLVEQRPENPAAGSLSLQGTWRRTFSVANVGTPSSFAPGGFLCRGGGSPRRPFEVAA